MKVIVLGCGPAGLLAAHGAVQAGADDVRIVSKKRKSEMFGAQYLHEDIPELNCGPMQDIKYQLMGTIEGYRNKVYGDSWRGHVSPDEFGPEKDHPAWNIRTAYDSLWQLYGTAVLDYQDLHHEVIARLQSKCDLLVSTIPAPSLCADERHFFAAQKVWAAGDAPERGQFVPFNPALPGTILCNGEENPSWYRAANVFGHSTLEWPGWMPKPPVDDVADVMKPLRTDCTCLPHVLRVGRYGRWAKGVLAHTAFEDVYAAASKE